MKKYQQINSETIDKWVSNGWIYGVPITEEQYNNALNGNYEIFLTPTKTVPKKWLENIKHKKVLGLASGGAQQMPILKALGAEVTCLDISNKQIESERNFAAKMGYDIELVIHDMSEKLPFDNETFDMIFHPVSNVYIKEVEPVFKECYRILKKEGLLLSGLDNGLNFAFDEDEARLNFSLPFNPLEDKEQFDYMVENDYGIQFSHTIEEQIGTQLKSGFTLLDLYEDTNTFGALKDNNITTFIATLARK